LFIYGLSLGNLAPFLLDSTKLALETFFSGFLLSPPFFPFRWLSALVLTPLLPHLVSSDSVTSGPCRAFLPFYDEPRRFSSAVLIFLPFPFPLFYDLCFSRGSSKWFREIPIFLLKFSVRLSFFLENYPFSPPLPAKPGFLALNVASAYFSPFSSRHEIVMCQPRSPRVFLVAINLAN